MIDLKNIINKVNTNIIVLKEFIASSTSINVILKFYLSKYTQKKNVKVYSGEIAKFRHQISKLNISTDWFTPNIPYWITTFDALGLSRQGSIKCLEIGSWEGLSTVFFLAIFLMLQ